MILSRGGACVAGRGGVHGWGACVAEGYAWWGPCVAGGVCGGDMHGGMHGRDVCDTHTPLVDTTATAYGQ